MLYDFWAKQNMSEEQRGHDIINTLKIDIDIFPEVDFVGFTSPS